jgi:hypothetical protein
MAFGLPEAHFSNKRAIKNHFTTGFAIFRTISHNFASCNPMQIENKGVGHPLTKFQTRPRWAWEISIFKLKPTFFALIGHRDAQFGDFRCNYEFPVGYK